MPQQQERVVPTSKDILKPLLYADIFDYPLTFEEIHKFLEFKATPTQVSNLLQQAIEAGKVVQVDDYYSLSEKPHLAEIRQQRYQAAQKLWPKALYYGRWIASLPFINLVAITGSLAVNNPRDQVDDIDFFVITKPNRLWLCRAWMILMVRFGHLRGVHLCPNYLLTENAITFQDTNLYIARELLQMVPIYGKVPYLELRAKNDWVTDYLPQGDGLNLTKLDDSLSSLQRLMKRIGEIIFGGGLGNFAEKVLQKKQIRKHLKLAEQYGALDKVTFTADECKGHYDGHGKKTLNAYQQRVTVHNYE